MITQTKYWFSMSFETIKNHFESSIKLLEEVQDAFISTKINVRGNPAESEGAEPEWRNHCTLEIIFWDGFMEHVKTTWINHRKSHKWKTQISREISSIKITKGYKTKNRQCFGGPILSVSSRPGMFSSPCEWGSLCSDVLSRCRL